MGLDIGPIRQALADQIQNNIDRRTNVYRYSTAWALPAVTIEPSDPFVSVFETMGPDGQSDIELDVCIYAVAAVLDDAEMAIDDYLSIGNGNNSSVVDAIHADLTLGGLVESCKCLTVGAPTVLATGVVQVRLHVQIILRKVGANA